MDINNPQTFDHIEEANGAIVKCKLFDIDDWDMDTNATVDVELGITYANVIAAQAVVRNDGDTVRLFSNWMKNGISPATEINLELLPGPPVIIRLERPAGGWCDGAGYNDTPYNRGTVFVWYTD